MRTGAPEPIRMLGSVGTPNDFDFWLGTWRGDDGANATNVITKEYGGHVVYERFDGSPGVDGGVVVLNAEDDEADTIVPRLMAMNADLTRVRLLKTFPGSWI